MRVSKDGVLTEEMITFTDDPAPDPNYVQPTFPEDLDRFVFHRAEVL